MPQLLSMGQPAPFFRAAALSGNPRFTFDTAGGRWVVMLFLGSASHGPSKPALETVQAHADLFDDERCCFFGVTIDPADATSGKIAQRLPGIRWFLDFDHNISKLYGAVHDLDGKMAFRPHWLLLDPMLRVSGVAPIAEGERLFDELKLLLAHAEASAPGNAPVLVVPGVFPPDLCQRLIAQYEESGGEDSGFVREIDGITKTIVDHGFKRRRDHLIEDAALVGEIKAHIDNSLRPMIERAFQFKPTRIERFIVACYEAETQGHFNRHRDNTTAGTAHRKFACTINLNAEGYDGGDLSFPEFGRTRYRAPTGGAVVFSCGLLHEAHEVTRGKRYAFLPFFYDEEGAKIREANMPKVEEKLQGYKHVKPTA